MTLRENSPYSGLFLSAFSRIRTEYREILRITPYSALMRENTDQNNSKYGHFFTQRDPWKFWKPYLDKTNLIITLSRRDRVSFFHILNNNNIFPKISFQNFFYSISYQLMLILIKKQLSANIQYKIRLFKVKIFI